MPLEVIGVGMGRTGTHSLKLALTRLGFGPCHHMTELIGSEEHTRLWRAHVRGESPGWEKLYAGYRSAVDWPTAHYWRELAAAYPDAKLVLTVRDPESWHKSVVATIANAMTAGNNPESFAVKVIGNEVFGGRILDRAHAIAVYEAHNAAVKSAFGPDRLLVYEVAEGWEPLCAHLGVPVPDEPFPLTNTTAEFRAHFGSRLAIKQ
jgi:hypothetical protein